MRLADHPRLVVTLFLLALFGTLGFSIWCHWPWLVVEHCRLEPAKAVLVWFGDAAVVLWCVWFALRYCLLRCPLPSGPENATREGRYVLTGLLLALGIDLAVTVLTTVEEARGSANTEAAAGQVVGGWAKANRKKAFLHCRFQDSQGLWQDGWLQVGISSQPALVREAIQDGRFPIPVGVRYDPMWPNRCWLVGYDNEEDNRIHYMSLCFLFFQGLTLPLAMWGRYWPTSEGVIPVYKVYPLLTETGLLFLSGVAKLLEGEW